EEVGEENGESINENGESSDDDSESNDDEGGFEPLNGDCGNRCPAMDSGSHKGGEDEGSRFSGET
ncbi:hypothetical protein Tco_0075512, partial [Tanacetum coccineum]